LDFRCSASTKKKRSAKKGSRSSPSNDPCISHKIGLDASKRELGAQIEIVDHVVVGSGVCGLVAAQELQSQGKSYLVLEKSGNIMGCWAQAANSTSHVAVSEPAYRFDYDHEGKHPSDFTGRDELIADAQRYVAAHNISITFHAKVVKVEQIGAHNWEVSFVKDEQLCIARCRGVFLALGAQQDARTFKFDGEERFEGTISSGIRDHMDKKTFPRGESGNSWWWCIRLRKPSNRFASWC
jgi:predicted NAD/FAD-dependent oxidoreductase